MSLHANVSVEPHFSTMRVIVSVITFFFQVAASVAMILELNDPFDGKSAKGIRKKKEQTKKRKKRHLVFRKAVLFSLPS